MFLNSRWLSRAVVDEALSDLLAARVIRDSNLTLLMLRENFWINLLASDFSRHRHVLIEQNQ